MNRFKLTHRDTYLENLQKAAPQDNLYQLTSIVRGWRGAAETEFHWFVPARTAGTDALVLAVPPDRPKPDFYDAGLDQYMSMTEVEALQSYLAEKGHRQFHRKLLVDGWGFNLWSDRRYRIADSAFVKLEDHFDYPLDFRCWGEPAGGYPLSIMNANIPEIVMCTVSNTFTAYCAITAAKFTAKPLIGFHLKNRPGRMVDPRFARKVEVIVPPDMAELAELYGAPMNKSYEAEVLRELIRTTRNNATSKAVGQTGGRP